MRNCNGCCVFCPNPCNRGKVEVTSKPASTPLQTENGLAVVENVGEYEVTRSIFGKTKVRKVK